MRARRLVLSPDVLAGGGRLFLSPLRPTRLVPFERAPRRCSRSALETRDDAGRPHAMRSASRRTTAGKMQPPRQVYFVALSLNVEGANSLA